MQARNGVYAAATGPSGAQQFTKTSNMPTSKNCDLAFVRLKDVAPEDIAAHMSHPRLRDHMPLLKGRWDLARVSDFIAAKEENWSRDGLGHWAILHDGQYIGWGGFQKEGDDWDYGLVLKPDCFGLGLRVTAKALDFARADVRIPHVTCLLPPSRKNLGALARIGAQCVGETSYGGASFLKYRLETSGIEPDRHP